MARTIDREQALKLRKQGMSIGDISKALNASKSSVSQWCRNISLSEKQITVLLEKKNRLGTRQFLKIAEQRKQQRIVSTQEEEALGAQLVNTISKRDLFILGLGLYWGEGYKTGNDELGFTNSDPHIIQTYIQWLADIFNIPSNQLILRVSINSIHAPRIEKVISFWSSLTQIPKTQFTKTSLIKTKIKKEYSNNETHYGTLRVKVRKGTALRRRIMGAIKYIPTAIKSS